MTCNEAAESISALCDGETIPSPHAEHIGACESCHARMSGYMEIGAELRRLASLEFSKPTAAKTWVKQESALDIWWRKGWEMMRIPRFAFALMLVGILVLGSGLAGVAVRARTQGTVVLLKITPAPGQSIVCPLSTSDKKWQSCELLRPLKSGLLMCQVSFLSRDGNRVELGVRDSFTTLSPGKGNNVISPDEMRKLPQAQYWFEPGETLQIDVAGLGKMMVTGEWDDHMPSMIADNHDLDPGPEELRMISPILLRNNQVVGDLEGMIVIADRLNRGIFMSMPGQGRFELSLSPLAGGVQGVVKLNRVSFEIDNESYVFLTGAPVARSGQVWILRNTDFKPPSGLTNGYIGQFELNQPAPDESGRN